MARRGLQVDLRLALSEAKKTRRAAVRPRVEIEGDDTRQAVELTVVPLSTRDGAEPLFLVIFVDAGPSLPKGKTPLAVDAVPSSDGIVEQLELDLRDTRERLQSMAEEYETVTEELKSANEEMVSVNEELQSINEELETSKEELQSVNEEQRATNLELAGKVEALDLANADLRNLFDSTQIATVFLDKHLVIRNFTPAVTAIFDLVPSDRGRSLTSFTNHLDQVDLRQELLKVLGEREVIERRVTTRDGIAHYLMRMLPYRTVEGVVDGVVLTFFDVTKVVEGEVLGTLVDELNHRVRNMLQVVSSIAAHTLRRAASLEDFGTTFSGRLRALARAHEMVSLGDWSAVPMLDLVMKELQPYAAGPDRITIQGPPVQLKSGVALSLGMVLHEMATNAVKYGALSSDFGHVTVTWLAEGTGLAQQLVLHWVEDGGPKIEKLPKRRGFGSELIERQLRHDLGGTIDIDYAEAGVRMTLTLPLGIIAGPDPTVPKEDVC
jgi:two-component system CheB/CheR fusion protein